jgi:phage-related protein
MKTLTSPVSTEAAALTSGWAEIYDVYLPASITTPFGTTDVLRVANYSGNLAFFTPQTEPEPTGTQGDAATYIAWPVTRDSARSSGQSKDDRLTVTFSNVTGEWADMLAAVDWRRARLVIRKVPTTSSSTLTADDCTTLFSGRVNSAAVSLQSVALACSSDLGTFTVQLPRDTFHSACRFKWADDGCGAMRFHVDHYKAKTCGSGSTTTTVNSSGLTEDDSTGSYGTDLVNALASGDFTASSSQTGFEGYRVKSSEASSWQLSTSRSNWGDCVQGYWEIPSAEEGRKNPLLNPNLRIDFGSAVTPKVWRLTSVANLGRETMPRLWQFHSSPDATTYTHELDFEMPANEGAGQTVGEALIPHASSARYWKLCLRSRWAVGHWVPALETVEAYAAGRHYWRAGRITFGAATTTAALRNVSRVIKESWNGSVVLERALPVAPASGDTFVIERGCNRSFNACAERRRTEFFGGFPNIGQEISVAASGATVTAPGAGNNAGDGSTNDRYIP